MFHTHFVGALVGGIGTGLFATSSGCAAFGLANPGGAIDGNGRQVWVQIVSALFIIGWNAVWTSLILLFIKYVLRVPLRMSDTACAIGDYAVHAEESYTFAYYNRALLARREGEEKGDVERGMTGMIMGRAISEDPHQVTSGPPGDEMSGMRITSDDHVATKTAESKKEA